MDQPGEGKSEETSRQRQWPKEKVCEGEPRGPVVDKRLCVARIGTPGEGAGGR